MPYRRSLIDTVDHRMAVKRGYIPPA